MTTGIGLVFHDEVGPSQESGGGINFNYIPFSKLAPPAREMGYRGTGGRGLDTGNRGLDTGEQGAGYWIQGNRGLDIIILTKFNIQ